MIFLVILVLCVLKQSSGVIYSLNETEYDRLPPLFALDEFHPCLRARGDLYCYVNARLVANETSELLNIIQEYSAANLTHYDHNYIHWGICVTKTCKDYHRNSSDLTWTLEACLNNSLTKSHQLQTRVSEDNVLCSKFGDTVAVDAGDVVVAVVIITILVLNCLGSLYDFFCSSGSTSIVGRFLLCFSVKRNWQKLVVPSGEGPDPRLRRLKGLNGVKAMTTFLVVMGHSPLSALITTNNPQFIEMTYYNPIYHIFYNGNLVVQSFFIMSAYLLAFNIMLLEEKRKLTWDFLPKGIVLRWLRLTPPYAVILAFVSTWLRHCEDGPLWKAAVGVEVTDCRRDWYYNLLYMNNYVDYSQCMAHTWYIAADMQLSVLGLLIFCLLTSVKARKIAIITTFVVGLITPALHTYFQNLHAILLLTPEVARHYFIEDPTFNNLYKRGHTNMVCYAMGLFLGIKIYQMMQDNYDGQKLRKYRLIYWATVPIAVFIMMLGSIFYIDGIHVPLAVRVFYSSFVKFIFGMMAFLFVPGVAFKLEDVYRGVLEWRGWASVGRISYCAYLVHVCIIRTSTANQTSLTHSSFPQILLNYFGLVLATFAVAAPLWMLIESPFAQLTKLCFGRSVNKVAPEEKKPPVISVIGRKETEGPL